MPVTISDLDLRPATLDDVGLVADLDSLRDPEDPTDPGRLLHWWRMSDELEKGMRRVAVRYGAAIARVSAVHELWEGDEKRYGTIRIALRDDVWSDQLYAQVLKVGEDWLRGETVVVAVVRVREDLAKERAVLESLGYREDRRSRVSELDLVTRRAEILAGRDESRRRMQDQGVRLLILSDDTDVEKLRKLYAMMIESEKDIPTTVPWRVLDFDEWMKFWLENPAVRQDRFWIAREGPTIVGCSVLDYPIVRGVPWTMYTGTSRAVRGRGIAAALKYESMGQAIEGGFERVRTNNDSDNPAILRINEQMGYRLVSPLIEMHRELA
jgi:RimJ/RimL family protein N-acetyltransferase